MGEKRYFVSVKLIHAMTLRLPISLYLFLFFLPSISHSLSLPYEMNHFANVAQVCAVLCRHCTSFVTTNASYVNSAVTMHLGCKAFLPCRVQLVAMLTIQITNYHHGERLRQPVANAAHAKHSQTDISNMKGPLPTVAMTTWKWISVG